MNREVILERITPTQDEVDRMAAFVTALEQDGTAALQELGVPGRASVQGSLAKGTWLHGSADADLFLLLDPDVAQERLDGIAAEVGHRLLGEVQRKYAQHPYVIGRRDGIEVDVVPAYAVQEASVRMSAVDRTPFHTQWVRRNLTPRQQGDVRLLKQWLKGVGDYGAETSIGGLSGYLCEVLVGALGTFEDVVAHMRAPARIAIGPDLVEDDVSPWVVVDPVDAGRNCAAAVTVDTLEHVAKAAVAYLAQPSSRFFFPAPPRAEPADVLRRRLSDMDAAWSAVVLRGKDIALIVPQFQKAARAWGKAVDDALSLRRQTFHCQGDDVLVQFLTDAGPLPPTRTQTGPLADAQPNASRFRAKWENHPDVAGPVQEEAGRLTVAVQERHRTLPERIRLALERTQVGKHVRRALPDARILDDPGEAGSWAPQVADAILDREPWER